MTQGQRRLRGALIGCGFFAENHLNAWASIPDVEVVAVCDLDPAKAAGAAARFGVPKHHTDAATMLREERPDFVDVATTVASHRPLVELAASERVPTIVQKPFGLTMADCEAMVAACAAARVPLMVHENFRFQPPLRALRGLMGEGRIGRPHFGRITFRTGHDIYVKQPYLATEERFIISDLGVHVLDMARFYFGEVASVACRINRINPNIKGEDTATMLLQHQGGAVSVVDCSYATPILPDPFPETLVEIDGDQGAMRLEQGYRLRLSDRRGRIETRELDPEPLPWAERPWHVVQESVLRIEEHWVDCLRRGVEPETSGADNLRTFALVEAAYRSAETGETVKLGSA
jgi:predicted dehydrogenase